ncbi:MAG: tRNA1(Val) (adenine(37)-N6)-methyltransferase [Anaerovoracaceae bacterium]
MVLHDGERIDSIGFGNLKLIQNPSEFCYGVDAVLLADFAKLKDGSRAIDLGTGTGIIPLILSHKTGAHEIKGVEIQEKSWERATRNAKLNGLEDRIHFILGDVKNFYKESDLEAFDAVLANPPYTKGEGGIKSCNAARMIARHESSATLGDFLKTASLLLKPRGEFFMIHRPTRLVEIFCLCREYQMEPKEVKLVMPYPGEEPNLILIRCVKGGGIELRFHHPLYIYDGKGGYTQELLNIYERKG